MSQIGEYKSSKQAQNLSFLKAVLQERVDFLNREVMRLRKDLKSSLRAKSWTQKYQKRLHTLVTKVRESETALYAYNLALDKIRTSTDPAQLRHYQKQQQIENARRRKVLYERALLRRELEGKARAMLDEDRRMMQMLRGKVRQYLDLERFQVFEESRLQRDMLMKELWKQEEEHLAQGMRDNLQDTALGKEGQQATSTVRQLFDEEKREELCSPRQKVADMPRRVTRVEDVRRIGSRRHVQAMDTGDRNEWSDERDREGGGREVPSEGGKAGVGLEESRKEREDLMRLRAVEKRIAMELDELESQAGYLRSEMTAYRWVFEEENERGTGEREGGQLKEDCLSLVRRLNALHCTAGMIMR